MVEIVFSTVDAKVAWQDAPAPFKALGRSSATKLTASKDTMKELRAMLSSLMTRTQRGKEGNAVREMR
jgi:serine/threonine protein kinase HipA of HipAB toxin-antitoxin module